ncbi:MAG: Light-independent protochlorophyllide reductase subunit B [Firmicutes bacterium]|nr:Light-independent protochlorophyllide reductase subunit B [candidate division NPL-UPA2 bacterium]
MQLYKFLPLASDRMGALWTLATIKDCCILEYGPAGTTHYGIEGLMQLNASMESRLFTTHMDETDIVSGDSDRLERTIREIDAVYRPPVIFVFASSISSIIGTDIETICQALQPTTQAKLIAMTGGGFRGDFTWGVAEALTALANHVVAPPTTKQAKTYNIIGANADCYNFRSDIREIKSMMAECFGLKAATVFTADTSIADIAGAANAEFNLITRIEGIPCAEALKQAHGMPYIYGSPYGYQGSALWLKQVADAFGQNCDAAYMAQTANTSRQHTMYFRRAFYGATQISCVVAGNYDQATGIAGFMQELGIDVRKVLVNHARPNGTQVSAELAERIIFAPSEELRRQVLHDEKPKLLLGDGVLLEIGADVPAKIQVANPNFYTTLLFDGTPFVGPRGATYLLERMLNELRH